MLATRTCTWSPSRRTATRARAPGACLSTLVSAFLHHPDDDPAQLRTQAALADLGHHLQAGAAGPLQHVGERGPGTGSGDVEALGPLAGDLGHGGHHLAGPVGIRGSQPPGGPCLERDDGQAVPEGVVQLARDPQPFLGGGPLRQHLALTGELDVVRPGLLHHPADLVHREPAEPAEQQHLGSALRVGAPHPHQLTGPAHHQAEHGGPTRAQGGDRRKPSRNRSPPR